MSMKSPLLAEQRYGTPELQMPPGPQQGSPTSLQAPPEMDMAKRLEHIETMTGGTIPARMSLDLAQGTLDPMRLGRAAHMLASTFSISPSDVFAPYTAYNIGQSAANPWYSDPVSGGPISLATARRFMAANEEKIVRRWLQQAARPAMPDVPKGFIGPVGRVPGVEPGTIAAIFAAFAPIQGENMPLQDALGAAISIARNSKVTPGTLQMLKANLAITATSTALTPAQQIAAAHVATAKHITLRSIGDIPTAVFSGPISDVLGMGQAGVAAGVDQARPLPAPYAGPFPSRIGGGQVPEAQQALATAGGGNKALGQLNIDFYKKAEAGLLGSGDWFKFLSDSTTDYVAEGQKLAQEQLHPPIPFANTPVGRFIGKGLNLINRPLDAAWRALVSPQDPLVFVSALGQDIVQGHWNFPMVGWEAKHFGSAADAAHTGRDLLEIIHGHQTAGTQLQDEYGVSPWVSAIGELALASVAADIPVIRFGVDPAGAGLQSWENYKARFLVSGMSEQGRSAEAMAKLIHFRDAPVSHIGDLRNTNPIDYLIHEASRTKDPEKFFNRAADSFMTWHGSYGIDPITANRMWNTIRSMRSLGSSDEMIHRAVSSVFDAGFGVEPKVGSLAADIRSLAETQQEASTAAIQAEVLQREGVMAGFSDLGFEPAPRPPTFAESIGPLSTGNHDADQALAMLDDSAFDAVAGNVRMVEVPHHGGPAILAEHLLRTSEAGGGFVGKVARSILAENPRVIGPNMRIPHEGLQAIPDFRRALIRGEMHSPQELATAEREWTAAVDPLNPERESDIARVIGKYNTQIIERSNKRYGIGQELQDMILTKANEKMVGRSKVFSLKGGTEEAGPSVVKTPGMVTQLDNYSEMIDPVLYRQGIANIIGQIRKWERGAASSLGTPLEELKAVDAVKAPLAKWSKEMVDGAVSQAFLSVWKPFIVMRPAHIMRVVVVNEMSHVLAVGGLMRRLEAGKWSAPVLKRFGMTDDSYLPMGMLDLEKTMNQRDNTIEDAILALDGTGVPSLGGKLTFSAADSEVGHALAEAIRSGGLPARERMVARELAREYREPLSSIGINTETLELKGSARKAAEGAARNEANITTGTLRLKVPGLLPDDPLANSNMGRLVMSSAEARRSTLRGLTPTIGVVERDKPNFLDSLYAVLQNQFGRDPIGRRVLGDIADGKTTENSIQDQMRWLTDRGGEGPRYTNRLMTRLKGEDYTREDLRAVVETNTNYARQLTERTPAVARAAAQGGLTMDALRAIPKEDLPLYVHGHLMNQSFLRGDNGFRRARDAISHAIMEAPTNVLNRQPFFKMWYSRMYKGLISTEQARNPGVVLTAEKLAGFDNTARNFALSQVDRILYDYSRSNRFAEITRLATVFTHPFLAFPLTWGRVLRTNPSFIREATLLGRAGLQSGFVKQDPETGEYVIPESWFGGAAPLLAMATGTGIGQGKFTGGGWSLSAPLRAFVAFSESAFPVPTGIAGDVPIPLPGLSPPFQALLQQFLKRTDMNPHYKEMLSSYLFQYGEIGPENWNGLLPSWLRHALEGAFPEQFESITRNNTDHFLAVQEAMGLKPDIGKARAQAIHFAYLRAFFSGVFPAAPRISYPTKPLEDEYKSLTSSLGFEQGRAEFLRIHPDLTLITIARTLWEGGTPENPSPVPLPANQFVDQLMNSKGAKDFAKTHPEWVWAIIPRELQNASFDAGAFFAQLATGQRSSKDPVNFLAEEDVQKGWDAFFVENQIHNNWLDLHSDLGQTDPGYTAEAARHEQAVNTVMLEHPAWVPAFKAGKDAGVDPNVLRPDGGIARQLANDPMFSRTDVGKGLAEYVALHDEVNTELSTNNLSSLNTTSAHDLGITAKYEQGVNDIVKAHPDFYTAYRLFFSSDMRTGVVTAGYQQALDIRAQDPTFFDTKLNPWWSQFETLRGAPDVATDAATRNSAFEAIRAFVNGSYDTFPADKNPMVLRWQAYSPVDKQNYLAGLVGRPYEYITRFDRTQLMGVPTDATTEGLWSTYEQIRAAITSANTTNPNFSAAAAYKGLDGWVLANAKNNPAFAAQVAAANTLGYSFDKLRHQLFTETSPQTDASWTSFLDGLGQVQSIVEKFGLHGAGDFNASHVAAYAALNKALQAQADALSANDIGFAQQWALLEKWSGSTPAMQQYFLPQSYYAIGSPALVGTP